jgi:cell division protein FtsW (lipid II flippase)
MFFNGFTLLLVVIALLVGFVFGVRVEEAHQRNRASEWLDGETIEDHMKRDGWKL